MSRGRFLSRLLASIPLALLHASVRGDDVPKGEVHKFAFDQSKIFPGTVRDYWVYVPRQYDGKTPACLYVNQDGIQYSIRPSSTRSSTTARCPSPLACS